MSVRQTGGEFNKGISTGTEQQEKNTQKILQLQSKMSGTDPGQEKQHLEEEKNQEGQEQAPGIDQEQKARVRAVDYDQQPGGPPQVQDNIDYSTTARRRKQKSSTTKDDTDRASIASSTSFTARRRRMSVEELNRRSSRVGSIDTPDLDRPTQDPTKLVRTLELSALKYIVGVCTVCFLAGRFGFGVATAILFILVGSFAYWYFGTQPLRGYGWGLERQDGLKSLYTSEGESVEWLNFTVEKVCRSINPGFFLRLQGVIEDQLQALMPKFIKAIEIRDLDIGSQAPRIQMIHVFPPLAGQSEESIFGEVSFSFHAHPAAYLSKERGKIETSPPGVTIGVRAGIDAPPLTVRGELTALSGKIRFKIITGPEVPFVSKLTVAFTSPPTVETAVMPLTKYMNIMHLPLLKTIVNQAVTMGLADMVDPRSLTIDVRQLMGGAGNDTNALGVVCVEVREAQCDPASIHMKEMEDMYVTLSLNNQPKKSMSSTRVLTNDKDPQWNENLYVLIGKDDIVADTKVDIKVWDADKIKYDDMWGSIPWSAKDIVQAQVDKLGNITSWCQEERLIFDGWAPLDKKDIKVSRNKLHYKMTFHPKYQTPDKKAVSDDNKNKDEDKKKKRKQQEELQQKRVDPGHKSGILSVIIQQGIDLTIQDVETMPADEQKHPYNPNQVVSPYVVLYINDNKVFQTRNKLRNPSPHWNALSEHFIKDFETTTIRLSVKTSIDLERDPVIGTKVLQLAELFQDGNKKKNENENDNADEDQTFKECQTWVPLGCGIGSGKVLLTLKYKPVKLTLPQPLRTANVGTLIVDSVLLSNVKSFNTQYVKARLAVNVDPVVTRNLRNRDLNTDDHDVDEIGWYDKHLYFPLIMRQRSALYIHLIQSGISGGHKATGRLWLKQVMDDEWQDVTIGLHRYLSEQTKEANRNEDPWPEDGEYGQITMRLKIVPGFSPVFTHLHSFNTDMVGANPFHDQILTATAEKWMEEQASSVLTDDEEEEEGENEKDAGQYEKEMRSMSKPHKISKHRVLRKAAWGTDHVKHKIDTFREGFNSEARLRRSVTKET